MRITEEQIERANSVNLPDFLMANGFELKKVGREYYWKEHDSLHIKDNAPGERGQWFRFSMDKGGDNISFVREYMGKSFVEAVELLNGESYVRDFVPLHSYENKPKKVQKSDISIAENPDCKRVFAYLCKTRGLGYNIISELVKSGKIVQEQKTGNAVFKIFDEDSRLVGAEKVGTSTQHKFKGIATGSASGYGFEVCKGNGENAMFFESAIDMLSYLQMYGSQLENHRLVSMMGVKPSIIIDTMERYGISPENVFICSDNDKAGNEFAQKLMEEYPQIKRVFPDNRYKDWNDALRDIPKEKEEVGKVTTYGNKTWNDATDNRNKTLISMNEDDFMKLKNQLDNSGINYFAYAKNESVVMAVNGKDLDWLKQLTGNENLPVRKSNVEYIPPQKNIIGNAEYRYISDKQYISADSDTALKMAEIMLSRNVQFSGRIYPSGKATLTVSGADLAHVKAIQQGVIDMRKQFTRESKADEIIGNKAYRDIRQRQIYYSKLTPEQYKEVQPYLDTNAEYSGLIRDNKVIFTIEKEDSATFHRALENAQRETGIINSLKNNGIDGYRLEKLSAVIHRFAVEDIHESLDSFFTSQLDEKQFDKMLSLVNDYLAQSVSERYGEFSGLNAILDFKNEIDRTAELMEFFSEHNFSDEQKNVIAEMFINDSSKTNIEVIDETFSPDEIREYYDILHNQLDAGDIAEFLDSHRQANADSLKFSFGDSENKAITAFAEANSDCSFALANAVLMYVGEKVAKEQEKAVWQEQPKLYQKSHFDVLAKISGEPYIFSGAVYINDAKNTIIEHIRSFSEQIIAKGGSPVAEDIEKSLKNAQRNLDTLVPFLEDNLQLTAEEEKIFADFVDNYEMSAPELTDKEKAFLSGDIAPFMSKSVLSWDEIEDLGYRLFEDGYNDKYAPTDKAIFGNGLKETVLYEFAHRMQNGEDIRKDLAVGLLGGQRNFTTTHNNDFTVEYGENSITARYGNAERQVSYEDLGDAFLSLIKSEYDDIVHGRTVEDLRDIFPDITDETANKLINAFDGATMHGWQDNGVIQRKIKKALYDILGDEENTEKAFACIAKYKYNVSFETEKAEVVADLNRSALEEWVEHRIQNDIIEGIDYVEQFEQLSNLNREAVLTRVKEETIENVLDTYGSENFKYVWDNLGKNNSSDVIDDYITSCVTDSFENALNDILEKEVQSERVPDSLSFHFGKEDDDWISESDLMHDFAVAHPDCSFALGNAILEYLDEKQHSERSIPELKAGWYKKTDFTIHAVINGEEFNYDGRFDIGDGKGTGGGSLIDHIRDYNQGIMEYTQYPFNQPEYKERAKHTLDVFIPFLEAHSELTVEEQRIFDDFKAQHPIRTYDDVEKAQGTFKIYQLPNGEKYHGIRFEGMDRLKADGIQLNHDDYELVYEGKIDDFKGNATLESLFAQFNTDNPADFTGRSLSVSDVIVVETEGRQTAYYCDTAGFAEMPEFFLEKKVVQEKSAVQEITFLGKNNDFDAVKAVTHNDSFGTTAADGDTLTVVINDNADVKDVRSLVETAQDNGIYLNVPSAKMLESRFGSDFMQESHNPTVADLEVGDTILYEGKRHEVESISEKSISLKDLDAPDYGGILLGTSEVLSYDGWQADMEEKGFEILSKAEKSAPEKAEPKDKGSVSLRKAGDFYEMYGKNAEIGTEVLGLHMLSKHGEPMVGFPAHVKDEYSKKLSEAGYSVLIEQAFEINPPKRDKECTLEISTTSDAFDEPYCIAKVDTDGDFIDYYEDADGHIQTFTTIVDALYYAEKHNLDVKNDMEEFSENLCHSLQDVVDRYFGTDCSVAETINGTWKLSVAESDKVGELFYGGEPVCGIYNRGDKMEIEPYRELTTFPALLRTAMLEHNPDKPVEIMDFQRTFTFYIEASEEDVSELHNHLSMNGYDVTWSDDNKSFDADREQVEYIETILEDRDIVYSLDGVAFDSPEQTVELMSDATDISDSSPADVPSVTLKYKGDAESIDEIKDMALSLGATVTVDNAEGIISIDTYENHRAEFDGVAYELRFMAVVDETADIDKPLFSDAAVIDEIQKNEHSDLPFWEMPEVQGEQLSLFGDSVPLAQKRQSEPKKEKFAEGLFVGNVNRFTALHDEIMRGTGFQNGKLRVQKFYDEKKPANKEFADFLKHEYGTGGHSGDGEIHFVDHDSKGMFFTHENGEKFKFTWSDVAEMTAAIIEKGEYIEQKEKSENIENNVSEKKPETVEIGDKFRNKMTGEISKVVSLTGALPWYTDDCTVKRESGDLEVTENISYEKLLDENLYEYIGRDDVAEKTDISEKTEMSSKISTHDKDIPVYKGEWKIADNTELYKDIVAENKRFAEMAKSVIGNGKSPVDSVKTLTEKFGFERTAWLTALNIVAHPSDGRFYPMDKEWACKVLAPHFEIQPDEFFRRDTEKSSTFDRLISGGTLYDIHNTHLAQFAETLIPEYEKYLEKAVTVEKPEISEKTEVSGNTLKHSKDIHALSDKDKQFLADYPQISQPEYSPWGAVQECTEIAHGVFEVSTAGHGGIMIADDLVEHILSDKAREIGFIEDGWHCFEEDADAQVPLRELLDKGIMDKEQYFAEKYHSTFEENGEWFNKAINDSISAFHPEYWSTYKAEQAVTAEKLNGNGITDLMSAREFVSRAVAEREDNLGLERNTSLLDAMDTTEDEIDDERQSLLDSVDKLYNGVFSNSELADLSNDELQEMIDTMEVSGNTDEDFEVDELEKDDSERESNFTITDDSLGNGGAKSKFKANIEAIKTLKNLEKENRPATDSEKEILSKYVGWGGIPQAFDSENKAWNSEFSELKELLSNKEYSSARASTLDAFFTSPTVIDGIYQALENFGFEGGNVLEPAMGVGNFFGRMPDEMRENSKLYGVEIDDISGRIAKQIYTDADISIQGFEKNTFQNDCFDVAVGNVPFGELSFKDERHGTTKLHDFFFAEAIDKVKNGGILTFITSAGTLDKRDESTRLMLADKADFIGAIRLPGGKNGAFKENAGTEVTTDIIFLQKHSGKSVSEMSDIPDWVHIGETSDGLPINRYFAENPDMVLGKVVEGNKLYGSGIMVIANENSDLSEQLKNAISKLTATISDEKARDVYAKNADGEQLKIPSN